MSGAKGGCICGKVRYAVSKQPSRVTFCHCRFCQRTMGGAYNILSVFDESEFDTTQGNLQVYEHISEGSGKIIYVNFCRDCGTKIFLTLERFSGIVGIYSGTLDDPNWLSVAVENTKHIFLNVAINGTIIPAGVNTFQEHATTNDGEAIEPTVFTTPHVIANS